MFVDLQLFDLCLETWATRIDNPACRQTIKVSSSNSSCLLSLRIWYIFTACILLELFAFGLQGSLITDGRLPNSS